MNVKKQILAVWIVANLLFIPGIKSIDLVPNNSQHLCLLTIGDNSDSSGLKYNNDQVKEHCDKCEFFHDFDSSAITIAKFDFLSKDIAHLETVNNNLYNQKNKLYIFTRAPPNLT